MSNKVKFGLKNVHYAVVTETDGVITYDTPKPIRGAVNLTLDAAGESVQFYADDSVYYEENTNDGYTGSLEMALIPDEFRVDVLGYELDANGALIENKDAKAKHFALMFEFDGDAKKTRHVLYYVLASRPSISGSTRTNTKEPQTETMNITARPAPDTGDVQTKLPQGSAAYDTFFESVYIKTSEA
jgi:phi13 family phage major tail protein